MKNKDNSIMFLLVFLVALIIGFFAGQKYEESKYKESLYRIRGQGWHMDLREYHQKR